MSYQGHTLEGVLPLCRFAVCALYSPICQDQTRYKILWLILINGINSWFPTHVWHVLNFDEFFLLKFLEYKSTDLSNNHHYHVALSPLTLSRHPLGPLVYIFYRHRAVKDRFYIVVPPLLVHVKETTGVHRLWVRPNFSRSVLRV